VKLKGVVSFYEDTGDYGYGMGGDAMMKEISAMTSPVPQISAGEEKVTAKVSVTYEIR
jgi:uncharacterized protein YggE